MYSTKTFLYDWAIGRSLDFYKIEQSLHEFGQNTIFLHIHLLFVKVV